MVSPELQIYKCFGCSESGDMFSFVQKIEGFDFPQSLKMLAERAGIEIEQAAYDPSTAKKKMIYKINAFTTDFYNYLLTKHPTGKKGLEYLKKNRELTDKTIKEFKLGVAPNAWDTLYQALVKKGHDPQDLATAGVAIPRKKGTGLIDKFRNRIMFPLIDYDTKIVGFTGRSIDDQEPKYLNTQDTLAFHKSYYIYALDKAKTHLKKEGAVLVEGQMDVIKAHQTGIKNVVAVGGTALTQSQLKILARYTKDLIFCFDTDGAGIAATGRAIELAEQEGFNLKVAVIPKPYKDLDELIDAKPKTAKKILADTIPVYDFFVAKALKDRNKNDPYEKGKILEELAPNLGKIVNKVTLDHYVKSLAEELNVEEATVLSVLKDPKAKRTYLTEIKRASKTPQLKENPQTKTEIYTLAVISKQPLDIAKKLLYKLDQADFSGDTLANIYKLIKKHFKAGGSFDEKILIESFKGADVEEKSVFESICLWDFGQGPPTEKEAQDAVKRLKTHSIRKKLKELTEQIKIAEMAKNSKELKELTKKCSLLSEKLQKQT